MNCPSRLRGSGDKQTRNRKCRREDGWSRLFKNDFPSQEPFIFNRYSRPNKLKVHVTCYQKYSVKIWWFRLHTWRELCRIQNNHVNLCPFVDEGESVHYVTHWTLQYIMNFKGISKLVKACTWQIRTLSQLSSVIRASPERRWQVRGRVIAVL